MAVSKDDKVSVILHFDVWDEDGIRHSAAPITGKNALGQPVREAETLISKALAKSLVADGKATVPLGE